MANKSKKYCVVFPCSNMAEQGSSYCLEHRPAPAPKETDPFYLSVRWRRFRHWYLSKHPMCEQCERETRTVPAVMVDHVVELKDGGAPLDESNAQSLCYACHNRKTAEMKLNRTERRKNIGKI